MDAAGITKFAGFLGEKVQPSPRLGWLSICCPLSWRHEKGHDSNPSFGMRIDAKTPASRCHCFSCNYSGDQMDLVFELKSHKDKLDPGTVKIAELLKLLSEADGETTLSLGSSDYESAVLEPPNLTAS